MKVGCSDEVDGWNDVKDGAPGKNRGRVVERTDGATRRMGGATRMSGDQKDGWWNWKHGRRNGKRQNAYMVSFHFSI